MLYSSNENSSACMEVFEMLTSLAKIAHTILLQFGLNPHHGAALVNIRLSDHGLTQKALAEKLLVRPSSITSMLDTLEKEDLVFRQCDENDKRVKHIYLTPAGKALADRFLQETAQLHAHFFTGFTPEDSRMFQSCVHKIRANMLSTLNQIQENTSCSYH